MKCDELKAYNVVATADVNPEVVDSLGCTEWLGYDKYEVDEAFAEMKEENATLRGANDEKTGRIIELQKQVDKLDGVKKSAELILMNLLDCGLIKEWYFNGKFNAVLKADDPHLQIKELNAKLKESEEARYEAGADAADYYQDNRRLKRALWIARAELCRRLDVDRYLRNHRNSWYNENCLTWADACVAMEVKMCNAETKCRSMAEEYK